MARHFTSEIAWLAVGLFVVLLVLLEVGRRFGLRRVASDGAAAHAGVGALEGAVFALLGLLVAFTFSGAGARFDARRQLVVEETNAIGTAYLRLDLLPPAAQPTLHETFRRYLDSRLEAYRRLPDIDAAREELRRSVRLQGEIWMAATTACGRADASPDACKLLLPALNEMIDITTTRAAAAHIHPPPVIFGMLVVLALATALLAGYGLAAGRTRKSLHMVAFAGVVALGVYIIIDLEYPRLGLIRIDPIDDLLRELRAGMR